MKAEQPSNQSEIDVLELGREVVEDPTLDGFRRQGRPLTLSEMDAARVYRRKASELLEEL